MNVTRKNTNLIEEFDHCNELIFNNSLIRNFPLKWSKNSIASGCVKHNRITITYLKISDKYEISYKEFLNVLVHEMIHVKEIQESNGNVLESHGEFFRTHMNEINKKFNLNIEISSTKSANEFKSTNPEKLYLFMFCKKTTKKISFFTCKKIHVVSIYHSLKNFPKLWLDKYNINIYEIQDSRIDIFPKKRHITPYNLSGYVFEEIENIVEEKGLKLGHINTNDCVLGVRII